MPEADGQGVRLEAARRSLVLWTCFGVFVIASSFACVLWISKPDHSFVQLGLMILPVASAAAFLLGLCIGLPVLSPWPRLRAATVFGMPAMHVALLLTVTALLTSQRSALIEATTAQKEMLVWLEPKALAVIFICEVVILGFVSLLFRGEPAKPEPPC